MTVTPGAGYQVDPNNPNAVIPIGSGAPTGNAVIPTAPQQPAATAPVTSAPQPATPPAAQAAVPPAATPAPTTVVNVQQPAQQPATSATQPTTQAAGSSLALPANGSVVDLLNSAGQDSSFAARQQLAQQYGIQGYTGTAAQNQQLAQKYLDAFNAKKGTTVPQNSAQASSALDSHFNSQDQSDSTQNPQQSFFDQYMSMNPVVKQLYDTINQSLSSTGTQETFQQQYQDLTAQQGIPALQTQLMNINNVMNGTEDDIRNEITAAGGTVTESQVQALTAARNKTLLTQANSLQGQLQMKEDYVNQIMQFSEADRSEVDKQVDQKIGLTQQLADIQDKITSAAKDNYQKIIDSVGYQGLANAFTNDPQGKKIAEQALGLPTGALSNTAWLASTQTSGDKAFQFVSGTDNQASGVFDPNTGDFSSLGGGGAGGGTPGLGGGNSIFSSVIPTILGSGTFTKPQAAAITNAINNGEDPFTVIKNQAKNIMGQTEASKVTGYEAADSAVKKLEKSLDNYYAAGGDTGLLSGTMEDVANKLGQVKDPKKRAIATEVAISLQAYRNAISGTAYSNQEGQQIGAVFPGIDKSQGLNKAVIAGRIAGDQDIIDGAYEATLGSNTYQRLKAASQASQPVTVDSLKSQLSPGELLVARENADGTRHYVAITPDELWATDIKQ